MLNHVLALNPKWNFSIFQIGKGEKVIDTCDHSSLGLALRKQVQDSELTVVGNYCTRT